MAEIRSIAVLSTRITRLLGTLTSRMGDISEPPQEEMIELTRSLLHNFDEVTKRTRQRDTTVQDPPALTGIFADLEDCLRRNFIDPSAYLSEMYSPPSCAQETGAILMLLSCHQRLLDLFKHAFILYHHHLSRNSIGHRARMPTGPLVWHSGDNATAYTSPGNSDAKCLSNAKIIMAVELILHLLSKMERAQCKLLDVWSIGAATPSHRSPPSSNDMTASQSSGAPHSVRSSSRIWQPTVRLADTSTASKLASPPGTEVDELPDSVRFDGIERVGTEGVDSRANKTRPGAVHARVGELVIEAAVQKQAGLYVHAEMIKRLIGEGDEI
ncbi:hypothetical protein Hte_008876 [Hypoxylon texense]